MRRLNTFSLAYVAVLAAIGGVAHGQVPSTNDTSDSNYNTGSGTGTLWYSAGIANTAFGFGALYFQPQSSNNTGSFNTATGLYALYSNDTGSYNTATGVYALTFNDTGSYNTASGGYALYGNQSGNDNTAAGYGSLGNNTSGGGNTASGYYALNSNGTGSNNTAFGFQAMGLNTTGTGNAAQGYYALYRNTIGTRDVAVGNYALQGNTTGKYNIGIGWNAGGNLTKGSDNIDIASFGVAGEAQTMRLGRQGTAAVVGSGITRTFMAAVYGVTTGLAGAAVVIDANGQLGTVSSSRRYKQDIQPMADASERLMQLRPVKFRYKQPDAKGEKPIQYGLIAEEVAQVFPELVVRNKAGQPETVAYHVLPTLLLNELQKEHRQLVAQQQQLATQASQLAEVHALKQQLAEVRELLAAMQLQPKTAQLAMR